MIAQNNIFCWSYNQYLIFRSLDYPDNIYTAATTLAIIESEIYVPSSLRIWVIIKPSASKKAKKLSTGFLDAVCYSSIDMTQGTVRTTRNIVFKYSLVLARLLHL